MRFPLFSLGQKGKSPNVTAQERINCYAEIQQYEDKSRLSLYALPGVELLTDLGANPVRGAYVPAKVTRMFDVAGSTLYEIDNAGVATSRGTLNTSSGYVCIADDGTTLLIVDGVNGYTFNMSTNTFAQVADVNFPNGAFTCAFLGHLIVTGKRTRMTY